MTNIEAIETIKTAIAEVEWEYPMDYAVALDAAIEALEKQIPKKPTILTGDFGGRFDYPACPNCKNDDIVDAYCPYCGQAIDWSDTE